EDVFFAQHLGHESRHRAKHLVASKVTEGVVDALEMVQIEQEDRERRLVPGGVGELGTKSLLEVLAIVSTHQRVAHARFEEMAEQRDLDLVGEAEPELDGAPDANAIALRQQVARYPIPANEGAVARSKIVEKVDAWPRARNASVLPADSWVVDSDGAFAAAADQRLASGQGEDGAGIGPTEKGQRGACLIHSALQVVWRTGERNG